MTREEAIEKAKQAWPAWITSTTCTEGWVEEKHGVCVVGVRKMCYKRGEWEVESFSVKGMGKTWEDAFKNAKGGSQ